MCKGDHPLRNTMERETGRKKEIDIRQLYIRRPLPRKYSVAITLRRAQLNLKHVLIIRATRLSINFYNRCSVRIGAQLKLTQSKGSRAIPRYCLLSSTEAPPRRPMVQGKQWLTRGINRYKSVQTVEKLRPADPPTYESYRYLRSSCGYSCMCTMQASMAREISVMGHQEYEKLEISFFSISEEITCVLFCLKVTEMWNLFVLRIIQ